MYWSADMRPVWFMWKGEHVVLWPWNGDRSMDPQVVRILWHCYKPHPTLEYWNTETTSKCWLMSSAALRNIRSSLLPLNKHDVAYAVITGTGNPFTSQRYPSPSVIPTPNPFGQPVPPASSRPMSASPATVNAASNHNQPAYPPSFNPFLWSSHCCRCWVM